MFYLLLFNFFFSFSFLPSIVLIKKGSPHVSHIRIQRVLVTQRERERKMEQDYGEQKISNSNVCEKSNKSRGSAGKIFDRVKPYLLMVGLQFGAGGMYITSMATLNHGMSRYVLIVYRNAIAALVLAPFALIFDRYALYNQVYISILVYICIYV